MSRRQHATGSPARRHRKAAAEVAESPAPPTPDQLQRLKELRLRQVAAEMQAAIDQAIAEDRDEWLATTGRPMPMNVDECVIEARIAGFETALAEAGEYDLKAIRRQATAAKVIREQRVADEIAVQTTVAEGLNENLQSRTANAMSLESRKVLAALEEWDAKSLANKMTRIEIQNRTRLSECQLRNVMERQLPKQAVALVETRTGPGGGVWLTPEGAAIAAGINRRILPDPDHSAAGKKH